MNETISTTKTVQEISEDDHDCRCSFRRVIFDRNINLESYQLVWLETSESLVPPIQDLREIIDYTKLFTTPDKCLDYIEQTKDVTTIVVCSQEFGSVIISKLENQPHILKIYIYDFLNIIKSSEKIRSSSNSMVKETKYTNSTELLTDLQCDVEHHAQFESHNFNFRKVEAQDTSTNSLLSSWTTLVDFWFNLPYPDNSRQRFIDALKIYYKDQKSKLKTLEEFGKTYTCENAILWYTKDTFIYGLVNRAFRLRNIELLFLCGFFLQDLHRQLQKLQKENIISEEQSKSTFYRGQLMSQSEIGNITVDPYIILSKSILVNTSFFSTTADRSVALFYLNDQLCPNEDIQNVLFEIEVDLHKKSCRPFADISRVSQMRDESEILFMIGTSFSVNTNEINYDPNENLWIIKLTLASTFKDYEPNLKITGHRSMLKNCINLFPKTTSSYTCDISLNELEIIFQQLFEMYPSETTWISAIQHHTLALYQQVQLDNYSLAMSNYNESIELWLIYRNDEDLNCCINIAEVYSDMADCCYLYMQDWIKANEYYNSAIQFYHLALEQHTAVIDEKIKIYKQLGQVYELKMEVNNDYNNHDYGLKSVEYYKLYLECMLSVDSTENFAVYHVLQDIAKLYVIHHEFDQAILTYEKAIRVYEQLDKSILQESVTDGITHIYRHLITIYTNYQPNYQLALAYQNTLHEHNVKLSLESSTYEIGKGRSGIVLRSDQYMTDRRKKDLALHFRRLAKIQRAFHKNALACTHLRDALALFNEVKASSVDYDIERVEEMIRSMNISEE